MAVSESRYTFTCFHDATYGARPGAWSASAWLADRVDALRAAGFSVSEADGAVLRLRAVRPRDRRQRATQAYAAAHHDVWWFASRASGPAALAVPPPTDDPTFLQHIDVTIATGGPAGGGIGLHTVADGSVRRLRVDTSRAGLGAVDDLLWFEEGSVGALAWYLVQASKLVRHLALLEPLRSGSAGANSLHATVIDPLVAQARTLLDRCERIDRARRLGIPPDAVTDRDRRQAARRVAREVTAIRDEQADDRLDAALLRADANRAELGQAHRSAQTLVHNLNRLGRELDGRIGPGVLPDDRGAAASAAFEFANGQAIVDEALESVARAQARVRQVLADREQELLEQRNQLLALQIGVLVAVGLAAVGAILAGGAGAVLGLVIGAVVGFVGVARFVALPNGRRADSVDG